MGQSDRGYESRFDAFNRLLPFVMFRRSLAQLWPVLRGLWLSQELGRAKAPAHGLALTQLGPSRGFW